jgi:uncharacterized membrane protein
MDIKYLLLIILIAIACYVIYDFVKQPAKQDTNTYKPPLDKWAILREQFTKTRIEKQNFGTIELSNRGRNR